MPGMQFEYDEHGGTFYYFLLSFIALILIPATYYFWPRKSSKDDQRQKRQCHCEPCRVKQQIVKASQPWVNLRRKALKAVLIFGWVIFAYVAYETSQVQIDFTEFDPYAELSIDRGAEVSEIKKAYRQLSLIYHPDRETGDPVKFMRISKAYNALTNEEARKNWEEYGNPDGPGATHFGIALPKWIVEKQNSIWVLGVYALIFMVILPVCVGTWWYRSIKYSAQQVLIHTSRLYFRFVHKSPNMILKRVIMVLTASCEFDKRFNSEVVERPSDNEEIPELIRDLPGFAQNVRELPFCCPYSMKARALLHAHFDRKKLPSKTLDPDKQYILKKCPYLLNEMISTAHQLFFYDQAGRVQWKLNLDTLDNVMKTSQMSVQALWANKSPILQLPHVTDDMLRHFVNKKRNIRSLKQLVSMNDEDRRSLLRQLTDSEYRDVLSVCAMMPSVEITAHCEVKGEEDKTITAGSLVTVTVELRREPLIDVSFGDTDAADDVTPEQDDKADDAEDEEPAAQNHIVELPTSGSKKWMKNKKKAGKKTKKKGAAMKGVPVKKTSVANNVPSTAASTSSLASSTADVVDRKDTKDGRASGQQMSPAESNAKAAVKTKPKVEDDDNSADGDTSTGEDSGDDAAAAGVDSKVDGDSNAGDDEDMWDELQREARKESILETKSKETHLVHCPYFPDEKYEWWWMYMCDAKKKQLLAGPMQICTLGDRDEKEFRFPAPPKAGVYQYTIILRSDSYLGLDQSHTFKIDVKEARKMVESHPQWDFQDDEDDVEKKDEDADSESNISSDDEMSDDY